MRVQDLTEATSTHIAFTFGRFNPPTIGHEKLINAVKAAAGKYRIYVSKTHDIKKNPLDYNTKMQYLNAMFPAANISNDKMKTILEIVVSLYDEGWENITLVVGDDRIADFDKLLNTYNGVEGKAHGYYNFNSINVVSAGQRDPDAEGAEGMSASKLKAAAAEGDFETFKTGVAGDEKLAQMMYNKVRAGMGIEESLQELVVKQQKPKLDVLNNIASRSDGKPFPLSWNADSNEITVGGKIYVAPKEANKFLRFYDGQEKENQELMNKALQSASKTANLFKNIGIDFVWKQNENFADGKKKGKSRPGRVKRSGASCKGSVTSLRAKAKKASGEKAKMYHWCANMKSGRKK